MSDNIKIYEYDDFTDCDGKKCGLGKLSGRRYVCTHNNLEVKHPELICEWHPDNKPMNSYLPKSHVKVLWKCSKHKSCECHVWPAAISSRTHKSAPTDKNPKGRKSTGCPYCSNNTFCEHNSLEAKYPELKIEWHPDNPRQMNEYSYGSSITVWWICSKSSCGCHIWPSRIVQRTVDGNGCPFCDHKQLCPHNNLEYEHPELKIEWHPDNLKPMCEYASGSNIKVWWICSKDNSHVWDTIIHCRTKINENGGPKNDKTGCPHCGVSKGYSVMEINWLMSIEEKEGIIIRHALKPEKQFVVQGVGKVDGYCESTNTVYEFHGDYWHGNPLIFGNEEIHPVIKDTYGNLYRKTLNRDIQIQRLGYNLVVKWETEKKSRGKFNLCIPPRKQLNIFMPINK